MKSWYVFVVGLKQKLRDLLVLALTLFTAPTFVLLYWVFFGNVPTTIAFGVSTQENTSAAGVELGLLKDIEAVGAADGSRLFTVLRSPDRQTLERWVKEGTISIGLTVTLERKVVLSDGTVRIKTTLIGDATSPSYRIAAALLRSVLQERAFRMSGMQPAILIEEKYLGLSGARTPFEMYVPGLLVFAVIMLIFSSSMSVVREIETGTLARIRLASVNSVHLLFGLSAVQLLLGLVSLLITLSLATLLGFESQGSLPLVMAIAALASIACVGMGMVVASLGKNQTRAFLIASAGMFLLVLFSGVVFPRPRLTLFNIGGRSFDLFDILPTTHMGAALGKVMTLGAGPSEVIYEVVCLSLIALANFTLGAWLFERSGKPSTSVWEGLP
jgi:ABC-2 type transport system permease protein